MTARFERLNIVDGTFLAFTLAILAVFAFPSAADAQTSNKTSLVFEIKNFPTVKFPEIQSIKLIADLNKNSEKVEMVETTSELETVLSPVSVPPVTTEVQPKVAKKTTITTTSTTIAQVPSKKVGAERVYMHEPEIRAYICPKLGDKCNTFIAVLKAENGTHECTRDNRGLNKNGSIDIGLAQINWKPGNPWHSFEQLQDCKYNLDVALEMYKRRGFQPWYAYTKGAYLKHLPAVVASSKIIEAAAVKTEETAVAITIN